MNFILILPTPYLTVLFLLKNLLCSLQLHNCTVFIYPYISIDILKAITIYILYMHFQFFNAFKTASADKALFGVCDVFIAL